MLAIGAEHASFVREPGARHLSDARLRRIVTIPELYPELAGLLTDYFTLERARDGSRYQDAVLAFALTESHPMLLRTASDARTILASESELAAFESFVSETGFDFRELGEGVTVSDWLSDVVSLISSSV